MAFNIVPTSLFIIGLELFTNDLKLLKNHKCLFSFIYSLKYTAMRFSIYMIINVMIADHNIYSRLAYLLFIDLNNFILSLLEFTLRVNINIMTLFNLLFHLSESLILYNLIGSLLVIVIFVNLQNISCFVALLT